MARPPVSGTPTGGYDRERSRLEPTDIDWEGSLSSLISRFRRPASDAAHRLRVSSPQNLLENIQTYDANPLLYETLTSGAPGTATVTHVSAKSACRLTLSNEAGAKISRQSPYLLYQAGKSFLIRKTFNLEGSKTGVTKRVGYFDADNGIFFQQANATAGWAIRSKTTGSVVENLQTQSNWNVDTLDGTGPSGYTLDLSKAQFIIIDFTWFSLGVVAVGFEIKGQIVYCHTFFTSNEQDGPFMSTAHLPVRTEIENTGTPAAGNTTLLSICASVDSEGGHDPIGFPMASQNVTTRAATAAQRLPLLAIRPSATFNGITFRGQIKPEEAIFLSDANIYYEIVVGGAITGGAWTAVDASSVVEQNVAGTSIAGGRVVRRGFVSGAVGNKADTGIQIEVNDRFGLRVGANGTDVTSFGTLTLVVSSFSGTANVAGAINWNEEY